MTCNTEVAAALPERPRCQHLYPALAAMLAAALTLGSVQIYMRWELPRRLNFFAGQMNSVKMLGNVLQTTAFRMPAVMPIYGSSEMNAPADYRAEEFFLSHAEGFRVFPFGRPGNTCLLILEKIAAAGPVVRGKKVAIFLSPTWFLREDIHDAEIQDNITPIQLGAWMFSDTLSHSFKQRFAHRLLEHPEALEKDTMMEFSLRSLANESPGDSARFALLSPLGRMRNLLLTSLDAWREGFDSVFLPAPSGQPRAQRWRQPPNPLDDTEWAHLAEKVESMNRLNDVGTSYSVLVPTREAVRDRLLPEHARRPGGRDRNFAVRVERSKEWEDLALLVDGLKELGADAIFISQPFNGVYRDLTGGNPAIRKRYYDMLAEAVRPSGFPLMDYSDHEQDKYFFNDSNHPSAKAWIYYDHALDDFYHERGAFAAHGSS